MRRKITFRPFGLGPGFILGLLSISLSTAFAQGEADKATLSVRPIIGARLPLSPSSANTTTERFTQQFIQTHIFELGLVLDTRSGWTYTLSSSRARSYPSYDRVTVLFDELEARYGGALSISNQSGRYILQNDFLYVSSFGVSREIKRGRWALLPTLSVGLATVKLDALDARVKVMDSNQEYQMTYRPSQRSLRTPLFGAGADLNFALTPCIGLVLHAKSTVGQPGVRYRTESTDRLTAITTVETAAKSAAWLLLDAGIGLNLTFLEL